MTDAEGEAMVERALDVFFTPHWRRTGLADVCRNDMRRALTAIGAREMMEALEKGAGWFDEYATLHRAKASPDEDKAQRNAERAAELRGALAKARGGQ